MRTKLDQYHTGWRQVDNSLMGTHTGSTPHWVEAGWVLWGLTGSTSHWVDNSSMGTHTGPTSHWIEASWSRLAIALWGHTLDQHHTGLRQVEVHRLAIALWGHSITLQEILIIIILLGWKRWLLLGSLTHYHNYILPHTHPDQLHTHTYTHIHTANINTHMHTYILSLTHMHTHIHTNHLVHWTSWFYSHHRQRSAGSHIQDSDARVLVDSVVEVAMTIRR